MNTLAVVDTSKVYHEFSFDSDQLKHLKCKQWFIHNDLIELVQEEFDKLSQSNEIKIVYEQINHFDFNHVKCVEVYCEDLKISFANNFMVRLQAIVQYKLPWKGAKTYFIKHRLKYPSDVTEMRERNLRSALQDNHLLTHLIKSYKKIVYWFGKHDLTCYEFGTNLNSNQIRRLDKIFKQRNLPQQSIFASREFKFLGEIQPPMIMKTEVLIAFHGQFLADLNIEDILSLELANKDHRLSHYDHGLDHDIQKHLRKRLPLLYTNKKLDTYFCHEFERVTILRYFIYKYHDRFTTLNIPNVQFIHDNAKIIMAEYKHLKFNFPEDYSIGVDIISPEGMTVCSVSFTISDNDLTDVSIDPVYSNTKQIRMDRTNMKFRLEEWDIFENNWIRDIRKWRYAYFDISIQPNCQLDILLNVMQSVMADLNSSEFLKKFSLSIIRLTAFDGYRITDSMLNKIFKEARCPYPNNLIVQFKQITFDIPTVITWFKQIKQFTSVTLIDCNLLSGYSYTKMYKTIMNKLTNIFSNPESKLNVKFKNMRLDIRTIYLILNNVLCRMVCDNCHIIPSADKILLPKQLPQIIQFKNMTVESGSFIRITTKLLEVNFYNCHIQSKYDALFKTKPSMKSSRIIQYAAFFDTDIEEGALILIAHHVRVIYLQNCRIRCGSNNDNIIDDVNRPITNLTITFTSMEIDIKTLYKILCKLADVTFKNCRILCAAVLTPQIHLIELSKLTFINMDISREFTNLLTCFDVENNVITFRDCRITNENVLEMWRRTSERRPKLYIEGSHQINEFIYFELLAKLYENEFNQLLRKFKDGVSNPFKNFLIVEWGDSSLSHIDWRTIKIRSDLVNDGTIKLEYLQNDVVVDLFYEQNNLPNDSDVCEVDYY